MCKSSESSSSTVCAGYLYNCDVPGSPCLSKMGLMYGPFLFLNFLLVAITKCLEPGWFVGDPTSLARDNIYRTDGFFFNLYKN